MTPVLWWIKRDFRLEDNPALRDHSAQAILNHHQFPLSGYPGPRVHWVKARSLWQRDYAQIAQAKSTKAQQQEVLHRHGSRR